MICDRSCCELKVFACAATSASSALNCGALPVLLLAVWPPVEDPVAIEPVVFDEPALADPFAEDEDAAAEDAVVALVELFAAGAVSVTVELSANVIVVDDEPSELVVV